MTDANLGTPRAALAEGAEFDLYALVSEATRGRLSRRRLRSPKMRALLDSARQLLVEQLVEERRTDRDLPQALRFLSRRAVCEAAADDPVFDPRPGQPIANHRRNSAENYFRDTWQYQSWFVADVLSYSLKQPFWFRERTNTATGQAALRNGNGRIDRAIHELAVRELQLFELDDFRLQLLLQSMAPGEPIIAEAIADMYASRNAARASTYARLFEHYNLELRPDVTLLDLTRMLSALAEGVGLRRLAEPDASYLMDKDNRRSLLGKAVCAIFAGCVRRKGDGRPLYLDVRTLFEHPAVS